MKRFATTTLVVLFSSLLLYAEGLVLISLAKLVAAAFALSLILFLPLQSKWNWLKNINLLIFSVCLTLSVTDLILRPLHADKIWYRPDDRFLHRDYEYPQLHRFNKNVNWNGEVYGDLAAMSGEKELRQYRDEKFVTDQYGFRNYPVSANDSFDIIAIGDSYTYGSGTTQDSIWTSQLQKLSGLKVYNLATPGGPWAELMNLQLELPRIKLKKNARVVSMLFSGNDLEDYYGDPDVNKLEHNGGCRKYWAMLQGWRYRSPMSNMVLNKIADIRRSPIKVCTETKELDGHEILFYTDYLSHSRNGQLNNREANKLTNLLSCLDTARNFLGKKKIGLDIFLSPSKEEVLYKIMSSNREYSRGDSTELSSAISNSAFQLEMNFTDLKEDIWQQSNSSLREHKILWWDDDTHLNIEGNKRMAEAIYKALLKSDSLKIESTLHDEDSFLYNE